jgi:hypothetical protein
MTPSGQQENHIGKQDSDSDFCGNRVNESRRRFGMAGLAASGVLATLASRPVLGAEVCKSPSGFLSGNLSTHGTPPVCAGRSPGYWKTHTNWPIPNRTTVKFKSVFTCSKASPYYNITMFNLLDPQSFDQHNLGMHLVSAYLNAKAGWTPFLTVERIVSMWAELKLTGYFTPTAGVKWNAEQVVDYLKKTID